MVKVLENVFGGIICSFAVITFVAILKPDVCIIAASKLQFLGLFWTFYILGMNFSSFQAMEPKNEPS